MAGPGSPSYALRQWADGPIPAALADRLRDGGILTMASAAALTLGAVTIPVYEIYKVGADPELAARARPPGRRRPGCRPRSSPTTTTPRAATTTPASATWASAGCGSSRRSCRRARSSWASTATRRWSSISTARTAAVAGLGGVTVRVDGRGTVFPSGSEVRDRDPRRGRARAGRRRDRSTSAGSAARSARAGRDRAGGAGSRRRRAAAATRWPTSKARSSAALGHRDSRAAVAALLDLDSAIEARIRAGEDSPDLDNARSTFRALIARLGEAAATGGDAIRDRRSSRSWRRCSSCGRGRATPATGRRPT